MCRIPITLLMCRIPISGSDQLGPQLEYNKECKGQILWAPL